MCLVEASRNLLDDLCFGKGLRADGRESKVHSAVCTGFWVESHALAKVCITETLSLWEIEPSYLADPRRVQTEFCNELVMSPPCFLPVACGDPANAWPRCTLAAAGEEGSSLFFIYKIKWRAKKKKKVNLHSCFLSPEWKRGGKTNARRHKRTVIFVSLNTCAFSTQMDGSGFIRLVRNVIFWTFNPPSLDTWSVCPRGWQVHRHSALPPVLITRSTLWHSLQEQWAAVCTLVKNWNRGTSGV